MRCLACNSVLSDFEATRKYASEAANGTFVDLCDNCFDTMDDFPETIERLDLAHEEGHNEELFDEDD